MSFFLADENGYVADFATGSGLAAFAEWAKGGHIEVSKFLVDGITHDPRRLAEALDGIQASGDDEEMRLALLAAAREATEVLILSDGVG